MSVVGPVRPRQTPPVPTRHHVGHLRGERLRRGIARHFSRAMATAIALVGRHGRAGQPRGLGAASQALRGPVRLDGPVRRPDAAQTDSLSEERKGLEEGSRQVRGVQGGSPPPLSPRNFVARFEALEAHFTPRNIGPASEPLRPGSDAACTCMLVSPTLSSVCVPSDPRRHSAPPHARSQLLRHGISP